MKLTDEEIRNSEGYRRGKKVAEDLGNLTNGGGYRETLGFIEQLLLYEHRTLQQKVVSVMLEFLCRLAGEEGDLRNEAAREVALEIQNLLTDHPRRSSREPWKLPVI